MEAAIENVKKSVSLYSERSRLIEEILFTVLSLKRAHDFEWELSEDEVEFNRDLGFLLNHVNNIKDSYKAVYNDE